MNKLLMILTFIFLFPVLGISQNQVVEDINVSATVIGSLEVQAQQDLAFGNIPTGYMKVINPAVDVPNVGRLSIQGNNSSNIQVSFPTSVTLTRSTGTETLDATGINARSNTVSEVSSSTEQTGTSFMLSGSNQYYVFFGGQILTDVNQVLGDYTGTLTVTVEYIL